MPVMDNNEAFRTLLRKARDSTIGSRETCAYLMGAAALLRMMGVAETQRLNEGDLAELQEMSEIHCGQG